MPSLRGLGVATLILLLAGCSAPGTVTGSGSTTPTTPSAAAPASPTTDPTAVLPADFPADIPLIDGDILRASTTSTGWEVWISSADPITDYSHASGLLQDAGFTAIADQSINGAAGGLFDNDSYAVTVTAGSDAKYPDAVGYQVDKK